MYHKNVICEKSNEEATTSIGLVRANEEVTTIIGLIW